MIRAAFRDCCPAPAARRAGAAPARDPAETLRRPAGRPSPAVRHGRDHLPHFRRGGLLGIPARARARDALRERAARGPPGGDHRQPARISEERRASRASAASSTRSRRARWRTSSRQRAPRAAADLSAGCLRLHGRVRRPSATGIIRAGAEMVETMACATVPKIVVTLNHASGAGYYAMAGQGFDPNFTFSWPTARIGVMEGDSAVIAPCIGRAGKAQGAGRCPKICARRIEQTRADYERWLDARYAAARGHCDALIDPMETRKVLASPSRRARSILILNTCR